MEVLSLHSSHPPSELVVRQRLISAYPHAALKPENRDVFLTSRRNLRLNPFELCVRPLHGFLVTHPENQWQTCGLICVSCEPNLSALTKPSPYLNCSWVVAFCFSFNTEPGWAMLVEVETRVQKRIFVEIDKIQD
jgi:hypothetical protein